MHFLSIFRPLFGQFADFRPRHEIFPFGGWIRDAAHPILDGVNRVHRIFHARIISSVIHGPAEITGHGLGFTNKLTNFAKHDGQFFRANDNQPHHSRDQYLGPSQSKHRDPSLCQRGDSD